ncbi:MAG: S41 family peptidase [Mangrovibacterium sp.]
MKKFLFYLWGGVILFLAVSACDKNGMGVPEEDDPATVDDKTLATNQWIKEQMEIYYYWNDKIPVIDETKESDTEAYFYKLLYKDDDFSWITDDYASLRSEYDGNPVAMGYDPTFYTFGDAPDRIFIVVNYVYPESGAYAAGLRRGNVILKIDNKEITTNNYYNLYSGSAYSVQLGKITVNGSNWNISDSDKTLHLTSAISNTDPAIHHEVIDTLGYKIGYLTYVEFLMGKDDKYLSSMDKIFGEFKAAGISDLIVDLRYNPGGDIDAAVHLASEIAPASVVARKDILVNLKYNAAYQKTLSPGELSYKFENLATNMNLKKVYFLTTWATASASELVITGLDPYMDVVQVGDSTYGKFYGAYILPDDEEKWAILPIVMKYSNAADYTDFVDGLIPDQSNLMDDYLIVDHAYYNDKLIYSYPLGNPADPMTKKAIELIAGRSPATVTRAVSAHTVFSKLRVHKAIDRKNNLLIPVKPEIKELPEKE